MFGTTIGLFLKVMRNIGSNIISNFSAAIIQVDIVCIISEIHQTNNFFHDTRNRHRPDIAFMRLVELKEKGKNCNHLFSINPIFFY